MIEICSKDRINQIISNSYSRNLVIVSIHDVDDDPAFDVKDSKTLLKLKDSCIVAFDDVECDNEYPNAKAMDMKDADKIISFATDHLDEIITNSKTFYVQCTGGVSRSPAVAAALSVIMDLDDWWVFNNGKFSPNRYVYETLLNTAGVKQNKTIIDYKFNKNFQLWSNLIDW